MAAYVALAGKQIASNVSHTEHLKIAAIQRSWLAQGKLRKKTWTFSNTLNGKPFSSNLSYAV